MLWYSIEPEVMPTVTFLFNSLMCHKYLHDRTSHITSGSGTPKMLCGLSAFLKDSESYYTHTWFITGKEDRLKSAKGKVHSQESERKQAQTAVCPLPKESHGQCLALPAVMCSQMWEVTPTRDPQPSLGVQRLIAGDRSHRMHHNRNLCG